LPSVEGCPVAAAGDTPCNAKSTITPDGIERVTVDPEQLPGSPLGPAGGGMPVGGRTLVGGAWTIGAQIAPFVYTIAVSVVAGRILGPAGLGRQSFIAFVVVVVATVCAGGLSQALIRTSAEALGRNSPGSVRGLAPWGWQVAAVGALVGTGTVVAIALLGATPRAAWLFGALTVAASLLNRVPGAILTGTQHWREAALVMLVGGGGGAAATIAVVALGGGITGMQAATAGGAVAMLIGSLRMMNRVLAPMRSGDASALPELRRSASRFALASSFSVVLTFVVAQRSELFFLDRQSSDAQIAFYSVAFSATTILQTLLIGMTNVFSPTFARFLGAGQIERIRSSYSRALRLLILLAIPISAGGLVLGPPLISLAYGTRYSEAGNVLRILVAAVPLAAFGGISTALLTGYGRMRFPIAVSAIAAIADIGAAALLVPRLDAVGAAVANDVAVFTSVAAQFVYCVRLLGRVEIAPRHLARMAVASTTAAAAAQGALEVGGDVISFCLAFVVGIGVLSALAVRLRVLPRDDADWLTTALGDTRAHRLGRVCSRLSGGTLAAVR
jgi:O-antigen/teichoic acid export membrane protein